MEFFFKIPPCKDGLAIEAALKKKELRGVF